MKIELPGHGLVAALTALTLSTYALATDYEYIKIFDTGDTIPGVATFGTLLDYDIEGSQVVFRANAGPSFNRGIFRMIGGSLSIVATNATPVPGGTGNFTDFASPSISNGEVAFRGIVGTTKTGIYATEDGNLTRLVDLTTPVPSGSGTFSALSFGAQTPGAPADNLVRGLNSGLSNGEIVFSGLGSGSGNGIYYRTGDGTLDRIVDSTTPITAAGPASIENGEIALIGASGSEVGAYRYKIADHSLTRVAAPGFGLPAGLRPNGDAAPGISGDTIAFNVQTRPESSYDGIYIADSSGVRLVADGTTPVPGSPGTFVTGSDGLGFSGVSVSEGNVAFSGRRPSGGLGIYSTFGGELSEVISTDDTLFGRSFAGFIPASPKISGSNILFGVTFSGSGGTTGLYVAMGEHHWDATGGGLWDTATNWSFKLAPRQVIPTFVDPANGGVITGPASTTTLKSLTLGASESGIAQLQMQPGGQINVAGDTTVTSRGRLGMAGVLSVAGSLDNSGVIAGSGQIVGNLINRETGEVRVGTGQNITVASLSSSNAGVMEVTGGELEFTGTLTNLSLTGLMTARDAALRFGQLTNAGSLAIVAGTTDVHGKITNTGSIVVSGGAAGGTQTAIFHGDVTQNGTLSVSTSGTTHSVAVFLGNFSGAGGITGGGDVFFEGDLRPGNSPASITFTANVSLASTSRLTMEIGGGIVGTQYDHLTVTGAFTLGGNLDIVLLNGFSPQPGDSFDLLDFDAARIAGSFASIHLPELATGLSWNTSALLSSGTLTVVPEPNSVLLLCLGSAIFASRHRRRAITR